MEATNIQESIEDAVRNEIESFESRYTDNFFLIKTGNEWMADARKRPIPRMLFSELWFEGELCILFSDTNLGKSILAVQIAEAISKGQPIPGFRLEAEKQKVLYFDFELSDKQFEIRYSTNYENHYSFDPYFLRAEINPDGSLSDSFANFEQYLNASLERSITETGARILVIDNLTYLRQETERAKDALPLMKELKSLKQKFGLSILCLAHTPKRDQTKPISRNDLQGSKMLINFCDTAFAIGESSHDKGTRYLKQIKERNTEKVYDSENVVLCQISKPTNYLGFEFMGFSREFDHLKQQTEKDRETIIQRAQDLKTQGRTQRDISRELGISLGAVNKYLKL